MELPDPETELTEHAALLQTLLAQLAIHHPVAQRTNSKIFAEGEYGGVRYRMIDIPTGWLISTPDWDVEAQLLINEKTNWWRYCLKRGTSDRLEQDLIAVKLSL